MNIPAAIFSAGAAFVFLVLIFRPMEAVFPAKPDQRFFRPHWWVDFAFFLGQYLLWNGVVLWLLARFGSGVREIVPAGFRAAVAAQPLWLQAIAVVLISDFFIYWGHRAQHRFEVLWRFHSIHHSAEHLDWLAAH